MNSKNTIIAKGWACAEWGGDKVECPYHDINERLLWLEGFESFKKEDPPLGGGGEK